MKKVAVILAQGFEEGEALTIIDILRRANFQCDIVGFEEIVEGGHSIRVQSDCILSKELLNYDMVVLPGGYEGATNMRDNQELIYFLQEINRKDKYICAICAAPIVLEQAHLLVGKKYTAYKGYDKKINQGIYIADKVVVDGNIVTSRGPATVYAFAYTLVDLLGGNSLTVKKRMLYFNAFNEEEDQ